jgi:hypothetical protein
MSRTGSKGGAAGGGELTKKGKGIDFLATGFKVTTNCAFSVKIMENFKINSDHLLSGEFQAPPFLLASSLLPPTSVQQQRHAVEVAAAGIVGNDILLFHCHTS